jgi:hypothetical protein
MHFWLRFFVVCSLANAALGQARPDEPSHCVRISRLVIESNSLSAAGSERIVRQFREKTYPGGEIGVRIEWALKKVGYVNAVVDEPKFSFPTEGRDIADVTVKVTPGVQYRLGEIHILKATVFPPDRLRHVFSQRKGDLFDITKFGVGLERLRELYGTRGYINMVAVPVVKTDESRRIVDLVLEVDEGQTYDFGKLYLEGVEPHPGAAQALVNSWKPLEGTRYNTVHLQQWLLAHHFDRKLIPLVSDSTKTSGDAESRRVNVTLTQWPNSINR